MSPRKKPDNTATPPPTEGPFASNNGAVAEFTPAETDESQRNLTPADVVPFADEPVFGENEYRAESRGAILEPVASPGDNSTIVGIVEEDWSRLMGLLQSVEDTESELNDAKESASAAKKAHDTAQAALQRALARMRDGLSANQEPRLPFDAPAGIPEPSPDGLPYDGIHQSDVAQPEPFPVGLVTPEMGAEPGEIRGLRVAQTSAWLIERGWKHCDPAHCERYSDDDLDKLLAWARGDTDIPEVAGLTVDVSASK